MFGRDWCGRTLLPGVFAFLPFSPLITVCTATTSLLCLDKCCSPNNIMRHHWLHIFFPHKMFYFYLLWLWSHPVRIGDMQCVSACSYWGNSCSVLPFSSECHKSQCMRCVRTFWYIRKYLWLGVYNKVPGMWNLPSWLLWNNKNTVSLNYILPLISSFEPSKVNKNFADVYFLSV